MGVAKIRIDMPDYLASHKVGVAGSLLAFWGILYASRHETHAFIPAEALAEFVQWVGPPRPDPLEVPDPEALAAQLVDIRLWECYPGGYRIARPWWGGAHYVGQTDC
jgi:hypothetical protein